MSGRSVSLRDAGRGHSASGEPDGREIHVRAPFPIERAVYWVPRRGDVPGRPAPDGPYELVFERAILSEVLRHVSAEQRESRFGFLLGRLHRCPESGVHYALVDRALPAGEEFVEEAPGAYLLRAWAEAQPEFRRHPGVLIGWYHSHRLLGLLLSEGDEDANRRYFAEPWQCCTVFVPDDTRPLGGVFRPSQAGKGRKPLEPAPFWELAPEGDATARPVLDWTNYESREADPVSGLPAPLRGQRTRPEQQGIRQGKAPAEHAPDSEHGGEPHVSLVIPPESVDSRPKPARSRKISWTTLFALIAILALIGTVIAVGMRSDPSPQVTRSVVPRPTRPAIPPEVRRFGEIAAELRVGIDRYEERARDFDLGRIGCDLLTTGYGVVDESFIRLVAMRAQIDMRAGSDVAGEFEQLSEEVDDVNGHFDASGCPRPE